ncbi:ANGPT2 [Mytilus edulis]|uniref:ANGPT2 n=1 Tax=Mytilus edulis TaxID=6550 RepID=A0A8S3UYM2_MYTED|nr:ANGPT2 [Mytilus edulis]
MLYVEFVILEKCLHDNQDISTKQLKTDTQNILKNVVLFNEIVQLNEQVIDGIKGILKLKGNLISLQEYVMKTAKDCSELPIYISLSGVYSIFSNTSEVKVYCDMTTAGGRWTIIQRRFDGSVNFQRTWKDYENGFGDPYGNYWIDQDNDENAGTAYVTSYGPWWHKNCCYSGLNRKFNKNLYWSGQSPKTSVMMIRKLQ